MTTKVKEGAVYDDVIEAPADRIAELVEGSLYVSPRPSLRHANAASVLGSIVNAAYHRGSGGPGGWWILHEPELHFFGDVMVPDLAGWRRERLPELPDASGVAIAPDWLCEVLSPSTERFDRSQKLPRYALAGVDHLWLVNPRMKRLDVYKRLAFEWALLESHTGDATISIPPFEEAMVDLRSIWG